MKVFLLTLYIFFVLSSSTMSLSSANSVPCQSHSDCPYSEMSPGFCVDDRCVYLHNDKEGDKDQVRELEVDENEANDDRVISLDMKITGDKSNFALNLTQDFVIIFLIVLKIML